MSERFELEGITYYRQHRKCGKPGCHCARGEQLHGPYWYARLVDGKSHYIGKDLPAEIEGTRQRRARLLPEMVKERKRLLLQALTVQRLIDCRQLSDVDRTVLAALGFGDALVPDPSPIVV